MQSDRFARKIVGILALSYAARSRRLMRSPFGPRGSVIVIPFRFGCGESRFWNARCAGLAA